MTSELDVPPDSAANMPKVGTSTQIDAGIELRTCIGHGRVCGFAGLDAGYQHASFKASDAVSVDPLRGSNNLAVLVARAGVDAGKWLRGGAGIDLEVPSDGSITVFVEFRACYLFGTAS